MITTSRLLSMIRSAKSFSQAEEYHKTAPDPLFHDTLYRLMEKRKLEPRDMILMTGIERSYFYHILSGKKTPGRNMVLRIGFCLKLDLKEMNHLLQLAGTATLYPRIHRDAALIWAVQNRCTMHEANQLLIGAGEEPMYLTDDAGRV